MSVAAMLDDYLDGLLAGDPAPKPTPVPAAVAAPEQAPGPVAACAEASAASPDGVAPEATEVAPEAAEPAVGSPAAPGAGEPAPALEAAAPAAPADAGVPGHDTPSAVPAAAADVVAGPETTTAPRELSPASAPPAAPRVPPPPLRRPPAAATPPPPVVAPARAAQSGPHAAQPSQDGAPGRRAADRNSRWLRLRCGDQRYGLELLKVQEVVLPVPLLALRGTATAMLGIMNLRGQVVPVLDLGMHLGQAAQPTTPATRLVVLEEKGEVLGLRVSAVEDVVTLGEDQVEPPGTTQVRRSDGGLFRGIARQGGGPVVLLDASCLLAAPAPGDRR